MPLTVDSSHPVAEIGPVTFSRVEDLRKKPPTTEVDAFEGKSRSLPKPPKFRIAKKLGASALGGAVVGVGVLAGLATLFLGGFGAVHLAGWLLGAVAGGATGTAGAGIHEAVQQRRRRKARLTALTTRMRGIFQAKKTKAKTTQADIEQAKNLGDEVRAKLITPAVIRKQNAEEWEKAGVAGKQLVDTSRAIAYEINQVAVPRVKNPDKDYRRENARYRDPDLLPTNSSFLSTLRLKLLGYVRKRNPLAFWVTPDQKRFTVKSSKVLGEGGFKTVYDGVEVTRDAGLQVNRVAVPVGQDADYNDMILQAQKLIMSRFSAQEIIDLDLAGLFKDIERVDSKGRLEVTDPLVYAGDLYDKSDELSVQQKIVGLQKIARTLQAFHEKGLIHRDVKPENIAVDQEGKMRLADIDLITERGEQNFAGTEGYLDSLALNDYATHFQDIYALMMTTDQVLKTYELNQYPLLERAILDVMDANEQIERDLKSRKKIDLAELDGEYPAFKAFMGVLLSTTI